MITTEVYGFEGSGKTLKAAREAAQEKARVAMSGSYHPTILYAFGQLLIVYRTPNFGWSYTIREPEHFADRRGKPKYVNGCASGSNSYNECLESAIRHLVDSFLPGDAEIPDWIKADPKLLDVVTTRRNFNARYREAEAAGLNHSVAHKYACGGWYRTIDDAKAAQAAA